MSRKVRTDTVLRRRDDVRYRRVDGEAVVLRQDAGEILALNEVGCRILDLVDGRTPVEGLLKRLFAEYEADLQQLERDVLAFLDELLEIGVLEPASEAPGE